MFTVLVSCLFVTIGQKVGMCSVFSILVCYILPTLAVLGFSSAISAVGLLTSISIIQVKVMFRPQLQDVSCNLQLSNNVFEENGIRWKNAPIPGDPKDYANDLGSPALLSWLPLTANNLIFSCD